MPDILREPRPSTSPQSVTRVIRILEALCASPEPVSLADLSRVLETPKSSVAALLRGLSDAGFVVAAENGWRLGAGAFGLGSALIAARRHLHSSDLIREGMRRLARRSGETVLFAVADGDGETLTYVDLVESRNTLRFAALLGDRRPLYCTAGGRALLAALPDAALTGYLDGLRPAKLTERTETGKRKLAEIIASVRETGIAQTVDQASDGVTGTAAVIRDASGSVAGALIVAAPSSRLHDRREELAGLVRAEAAAISRALGFLA